MAAPRAQTTVAAGMTVAAFEKMVASSAAPAVLVDFCTAWLVDKAPVIMQVNRCLNCLALPRWQHLRASISAEPTMASSMACPHGSTLRA